MSKESIPSKSDFVGKIVTDPKDPPNTVLLSGYLGDSSEEGHTRLYFDLELSSYVEIPDDAILHREPQELYGHGHIIIFRVWIKRGAPIKPGRGVAQVAQARYFQGEIMKRYGAAAAEFQAQAQEAEATDVGKIGINASELFLCRTEQGLACVRPTIPIAQCYSLVDGCPSVQVNCETLTNNWCAQPSLTALCTSLTPAQCRSWIDGCRSALIECDLPVTLGFGCSSTRLLCPTQMGCPSFVCGGGSGLPGLPMP